MKLKILGSGSHGNCYILEGERETLLLECGIKWKDILKGLNYRVDNVAGCLISHEHKDHSKSINDVIMAGIEVYSGKGTFTLLEGCDYRTSPVESEKQYSIGEFVVMPFELEHDVPNLGFLIQHPEMGKLVYITDTKYCRYTFSGLNHILVEGNYSKALMEWNVGEGILNYSLAQRIIDTHFSLENVEEFLKANDLSRVKDIVLLHMSDGNGDAERFKQEIEGLTGKPVYIAQKGLEIEL